MNQLPGLKMMEFVQSLQLEIDAWAWACHGHVNQNELTTNRQTDKQKLNSLSFQASIK